MKLNFKRVTLLAFFSGITCFTFVYAAPRPILPISATSMRIVMYNEFNGTASIDGALTLSGGINYDRSGSLKNALTTGNFIGVEDGEIVFVDASGNVEQYNLITGAGVFETVPGEPMKPISGIVPNPHMGEDLIIPGNTKNPSYIDTYDDGVVMLDADGSISIYHIGTRILLADPLYTAFIGGSIAGKTIAQARTDGDIIGIENAYFFTLDTDGTCGFGPGGWCHYSVLTGVEGAAAWNVSELSGGALAGKTLAEAVKNTHDIAGITFKGIVQTDLVFYDAVNKSFIFYNWGILINTWAGANTTLPNAVLTGGGEFAGSLDAAIQGGRFLGVNDCEINFYSSNSHLQQYNCLTGALVYDLVGQPLEGPQANKNILESDFIDSLDDGYIFKDRDGTTSVYYGLSRALFHDQTWALFAGGDKNGQSPTMATILASEDGLLYVLENNGSLGAYSYLTGAAFLDLWTWDSFIGGSLAGTPLAIALDNTNADAITFLGIAGDQLVFAVDNDPGVIFSGTQGAIEGGVAGAFTVRLNTQPLENVVVNLIANGTDATLTPSTLIFTPENYNISQTVTVAAVNDTDVEGPHAETINYTVTTNDLGYVGKAGNSVVTANIGDNDAFIEFSVAIGNDNEGDSIIANPAGTFANLLVRGTLQSSATISLAVVGGAATSTVADPHKDYVAYPTTAIVIPAGIYDGTASTSIAIATAQRPQIYGFSFFEPNETIIISAGSTTGGVIIGDANIDSITQSIFTYTIVNDDLPSTVFVEFAVAASSDSENDAGTNMAASYPVLKILGDGTIAGPGSIDIVIAGGTAMNAIDYAASTTITVVIPAIRYPVGSTISIPSALIYGDTVVENDETIAISLQNITPISPSFTIGDANGDGVTQNNAVYTIVNDDSFINVEFSASSVAVSEVATTTPSFARLLVRGEVKVISTLEVAISGGSAVNGGDYNASTTQAVIIAPGTYDGSASSSIALVEPAIADDNIFEGDESIRYTFGNLSGLLQVGDANNDTIINTAYTLTITDNENAPVASGGSGGSGSGTSVASVLKPEIVQEKRGIGGVRDEGVNTSLLCGKLIQRPIIFGGANLIDDVTLLQEFLNLNEGNMLTISGVYDVPTHAAVHAYQQKYFEAVIRPWGITKTTGYVYRTTLAHMNARMCDEVTRCPAFTTYHKIGSEGGDISRIGEFMRDMGYYTGNETVIYTKPLFEAIRKFQKDFNQSVLVPWGLDAATGYWYETSVKTANGIIGCLPS